MIPHKQLPLHKNWFCLLLWNFTTIPIPPFLHYSSTFSMSEDFWLEILLKIAYGDQVEIILLKYVHGRIGGRELLTSAFNKKIDASSILPHFTLTLIQLFWPHSLKKTLCIWNCFSLWYKWMVMGDACLIQMILY